MSEKKRKYKKNRRIWNEREERLLIDAWSEYHTLLCAERKNGHIFNKMSADLAKLGCVASVQEIKTKIDNLISKYRKVRHTRSRSQWEYFHKVHEILGAIKAKTVINSMRLTIADEEMESLDSLLTLPQSTDDPLLHATSNRTIARSRLHKSPTPSRTELDISFNYKLLNRLDSIEGCMNSLVTELKKRNQIEIENSANLKTCASSISSLTKLFGEYLKKNT